MGLPQCGFQCFIHCVLLLVTFVVGDSLVRLIPALTATPEPLGAINFNKKLKATALVTRYSISNYHSHHNIDGLRNGL